jgi:hypothetical protein
MPFSSPLVQRAALLVEVLEIVLERVVLRRCGREEVVEQVDDLADCQAVVDTAGGRVEKRGNGSPGPGNAAELGGRLRSRSRFSFSLRARLECRLELT